MGRHRRAGRAARRAAAHPHPAPSAQKSGATGRPRQHRRPRRPWPSSIGCHRDSTTKQTLSLPGRTLAFTATAGSIRLFDEKGEPQADIAYTAYQLDGADPAHPAGDVLFQWRAGRSIRLSAIRRGRAVAAGHQRRGGDSFRLARSAAQRGDLARLYRSRLHRSRRAPATAASSRPATTCARSFFRSTATSIRSR